MQLIVQHKSDARATKWFSSSFPIAPSQQKRTYRIFFVNDRLGPFNGQF